MKNVRFHKKMQEADIKKKKKECVDEAKSKQQEDCVVQSLRYSLFLNKSRT